MKHYGIRVIIFRDKSFQSPIFKDGTDDLPLLILHNLTTQGTIEWSPLRYV